MARAGYEMVRYADDLVIQCRSREEAERALALVQRVDGPSGPDAASHEDQNRGRQTRRLRLSGLPVREAPSLATRRRAWTKFRDTIRAKTRRTQRAAALNVIIADVNRTLRGWFEYFKHSYRTTFPVPGRLDPHASAQHSAQAARAAAVADEARTIIAGPTPTLPSRGCSA